MGSESQAARGNLIVPVILSGGSGTRLWPLSRTDYPKQFLRLTGGGLSLFQQTARRFSDRSEFAPPLIVCSELHRFLAAEQLQEAGISSPMILLEPCGRNTAPALAVAALAIQKQYGDCLMLAMPSDHKIDDTALLQTLIESSAMTARSGRLVAFGVTPTYAATGYGYIKKGSPLGSGGMHGIAHFVEKPDAHTAQAYLESGSYVWNSGLFLFSTAAYLTELEALHPQLLVACRAAAAGAKSDLDFIRLEKVAFASCPSISVDHAVMEPTRNGAVMAMAQAWCDVGDWKSLWDMGEKDAQGNVMVGDIYARDSRHCYLHSDGPAISTLGVENLIVVSTKDAVLVARNDRAQEVRTLVETLAHSHPQQVGSQGRVYRPWGHYDMIGGGGQYQVKRLTVKPGGQLSLQQHSQRAEHWVVVQGTALVQVDGMQQVLQANESVYIPHGVRHRIENPGADNLHVIEVQTGAYLGEDDIVRFADKYGRMEEV